jgi:hypothetical protein
MLRVLKTENPTRRDIDELMLNSKNAEDINYIIREINAKEYLGKSLHPCEEYFRERFNQSPG